MRFHRSLLAFGTISMGIGAPALAQDIDPEAGREATVPVETPSVAEQVVPVTPPPADILWDKRNLDDLLAVIDNVGAEGLNPAPYDAAKLRAAIATGDPATFGPLATRTWLKLAHDFHHGYAPAEARLDWHMDTLGGNPNEFMGSLHAALAIGNVRNALMALLPVNPQYQTLKTMLATTPASEVDKIAKLRVAMERWRWMPRDFGTDYIFVNVPAFNVALVSDGRALARHRVIVGKPKTPTPQMFTVATGVIFNPTWTVPQSIIRESIGATIARSPRSAKAKGYSWTRTPGGQLQVVQGPGPGNALGAVKLFMPNPYSIYLHDTPSKTLFNSKVRAFSHGCIRTDKALNFAAVMLREVEDWAPETINATIATGKTTKVELVRPVNVLITYLTAVAEDNGVLRTYPDIYERDAPILAALDAQ